MGVSLTTFFEWYSAFLLMDEGYVECCPCFYNLDDR